MINPPVGYLFWREFLSPFKADIRLAYEEYPYLTKATSLNVKRRGSIIYSKMKRVPLIVLISGISSKIEI